MMSAAACEWQKNSKNEGLSTTSGHHARTKRMTVSERVFVFSLTREAAFRTFDF